MKTTVDFQAFKDAFRAYDREHNFSTAGLRALFDYIEHIEWDSGQEWELDVIALCCDYTEASWEEIARDYNITPEEDETIENAVRAKIDYESYIVGDVPGGCVYLAF